VIMGKEPVNIIRLKRQNDEFSDAVHHARDLQIAGCNALWFARDFTKSNKSELTAQTKEFVAKETSIIERHKVGVKDQIAQELDSANKLVAGMRKDRLKQMLCCERREHESELNAMGLAFEKHRD
jgi:hypothetical protein